MCTPQIAIVLDTDVIIRGEKGTFDLAAWLESQPNDRCEVAAITIAELRHGVERSSGTQQAETRTVLARHLRGLADYSLYRGDRARIWADLEASGTMIGSYDLIVAASALEHGGAVATFNQRHFARVRGLNVIEPRL